MGNLRSGFVRGHNGKREPCAELECCGFTTTAIKGIPRETHTPLRRAAGNDVVTPSPPLGLEGDLGCISS